jgi:hypothetical protein
MDGLSRCSGDALPYVQEQLWRIGETAVLGSNPVISPAYSGLPVLSRAAIWDFTACCPLRGGTGE